jgi:hypothetical protein
MRLVWETNAHAPLFYASLAAYALEAYYRTVVEVAALGVQHATARNIAYKFFIVLVVHINSQSSEVHNCQYIAPVSLSPQPYCLIFPIWPLPSTF